MKFFYLRAKNGNRRRGVSDSAAGLNTCFIYLCPPLIHYPAIDVPSGYVSCAFSMEIIPRTVNGTQQTHHSLSLNEEISLMYKNPFNRLFPNTKEYVLQWLTLKRNRSFDVQFQITLSSNIYVITSSEILFNH